MKLPPEITSEQLEESRDKELKVTDRLWKAVITLTLIVFILQAVALFIVLTQ